MDVEVAAPPAAGGRVRGALEHQPLGQRTSRRDRHVCPRHAVFGAVPHFHLHRPRWYRQLGRTGGVEIAVLESAVGPVSAIEGFIGVTPRVVRGDRKSTRLNSSHLVISYAVFCLKKKKKIIYMSIYYDH